MQHLGSYATVHSKYHQLTAMAVFNNDIYICIYIYCIRLVSINGFWGDGVNQDHAIMKASITHK